MLNLIASLSLGSPCETASATTTPWTFAGPASYYNRGDPLKLRSAGAIQDAVYSNASLLVGSVNGGVWKTDDASEAQPAWRNVLDGQPVTCASIGAIHVDSVNPNLIFAGCGGSTSSMNGVDNNVMNSGDWGGVMKSTDAGETWAMLPPSLFPVNYYVTAILSTPTALLIAAKSHLHNATAGGIWRLVVGDGETTATPTIQTSFQPTFTLTQLSDSSIIATHMGTGVAATISLDNGVTWSGYGSAAMTWGGELPFYTTTAVVKGSQGSHDTLVVGGLTVNPLDATKTNSHIYFRTIAESTQTQWQELTQPMPMDEDSMPKDRMALFGDPHIENILYVAGNAGALAWRVDLSNGPKSTWVKLWDAPDVADGSEPHGDCRNYLWDYVNNRLILTSDGGIFARLGPNAGGGKWVSLNGNIGEMEYLSASYDSRGDRFVGGAQDNSAQVFPMHSTAASTAIGFVGGDGTVTLVDNVHNPSRLFGTTQFLGVGTIDIDPSSSAKRSARRRLDDDEDCGGLCFVQGDAFIEVPLDTYFPTPASFPYFVQPYYLHTQDPSRLVFWVNGTNESMPSAFYQFTIADEVTESSQIGAPTLLFTTPVDAFFLDFVAGGFTQGQADPDVLIGMSNTNIYIKNAKTQGDMHTYPLPVQFAMPVTLGYNTTDGGSRILGPVSHGRTTSLAVSPSDSSIIAVTGWQSVMNNEGAEQVFLSNPVSVGWAPLDVTGNLREVSGVVGKVRPGGLLFIDMIQNKDHALLVSTANGVFVSFVAKTGKWTRLGTCADFPIVLTASLSYEHYSDTLVAATFGRGIYALKNVKQALVAARVRATGLASVPETESSAKFFPPQK